MPAIKIAHVISCSSQDDRYPVSNLLTPSTGSSAWLISPDDVKCGRLQAEFQLERSSTITHVDIGNSGSSIVELMVSRSCWTFDKYVTFLPAFSFNNASTSKCQSINTDVDNNKEDTAAAAASSSSVRMFSTDDFIKDAARMQWDRLRITCWRPFLVDRTRCRLSSTRQFGLSFVILKDMSSTSINAVELRSIADAEDTARDVDVHLARRRPSDSDSSRPSAEQARVSPSESRSAALVRLARAKQQTPIRESPSNLKRSTRVERLDVEEEEKTQSSDSSNAKRLKSAEAVAVTEMPSRPSTSDHECPICFAAFSADAIETHVQECVTANFDDDVSDVRPRSSNLQDTLIDIPCTSSETNVVTCPLCNGVFPASEIEGHASECCL